MDNQEKLNGKKNKKPALRFPEFINNGEWEEKKLGDIVNISSAGVDKVNRENEKEVKLLNYMDVYKYHFIKNKHIKAITTSPDYKIVNCNVLRGDIFITPSSETKDDIANAAVIIEDIDNCVYSYHIVRLRPKININVYYSQYMLSTDDFRKTTYALCDGGGKRYFLSLKTIKDLKIYIPTLAEQQKIADCLSTLDEMIEEEEAAIEKLKEYKKGLMSKLFPADDSISGGGN